MNADLDESGALAELRNALSAGDARSVRRAIREGRWNRVTHGLAKGFVQANLVVVPQKYAFDFLRFCILNPQPCPIVEVLDAGDPVTRISAQGADIRTDLPLYRIYRDGALAEEVRDLRAHWRDDHVGFLLGCSLSFDQAMVDAGIPIPYVERSGGRLAVYTSALQCAPSGPFHGPMVVTMRPIPRRLLIRTIEVTRRYPIAHGAPVHVGNPEDIGIQDLTKVDWGNPSIVLDDEVPVFWACGITPQSVAMAARIPEMFTHAAGHMFMTDLPLARTAAA